MPKIEPIIIKEEKFFFSFSFDIDNLIGDGIQWLQIYDSNRRLIYDKPFASSMNRIDKWKIVEVIKNEFLTYRGAIL